LLFELPAPPIDKLYGVILEEYAGERSPRLKELTDGAARRNKLIHRPGTPDPDDTDATLYVEDVQVAILHLVSPLYREDTVAEHNFRAASVRITVGDPPTSGKRR
jgi:hypothetical protein